ncbi:MAG: anhydro-N-acetylmuramic acid kinase [Oscillospiraceae bacterium]|nr:anhydro-N-acetylmuramic acid kinase [Oscillospiraceae bacterium]
MPFPLFTDSAKPRFAIGLMSGTSADGIDAALVQIKGCGTETSVSLRAFITLPFTDEVRARILRVVAGDFGGSEELCRMNAFLGELSADACVAVCKKAKVPLCEIAFVGSHGQTVFHAPDAAEYLGKTIRSTFQIGEASAITERIGCPVVSDFRVRDMAAGGLGAPLVPYTEYLLFRDAKRNVALQNIGGIGNITVLPKGCGLDEVFAFDTGPGNMVMDQLVARLTDGKARYDAGGKMAAAGRVSKVLLAHMLNDDYLKTPPPKTTGREVYGETYVNALCQKADALGVSLTDTLATATRFTAECIREGIERFCDIKPQRLIIGGGGSMNPTLLAHIADCLPTCEVLTNEQLGLDSNAKEAIAFAVLANETLFGMCNNAPGATGAAHAVVMGKISL